MEGVYMPQNFNTVSTAAPSVLATNKVIRNTYLLLSLTVLFSALTAFVSMTMQFNIPIWVFFAGSFGLMYLVFATANSAMGLVSVFLFTGFMGLTLGPLLNMYIHEFSNGSELVAGALAATGAIFFTLSGYAMTTRKDFSYLAGFLFVGLAIAFVGSIAALFFNIPAIQVAISGAFVLISSGYILFYTSVIVNGGERNYILATVALYAQLFNLFVSLLQILSIFAGRRD
jgi:modulator of FtsH protease